jgi:hypothetical protein
VNAVMAEVLTDKVSESLCVGVAAHVFRIPTQHNVDHWYSIPRSVRAGQCRNCAYYQPQGLNQYCVRPSKEETFKPKGE